MVDFFCRYLYISSSVDSSIIVQKSSVKTFFSFTSLSTKSWEPSSAVTAVKSEWQMSHLASPQLLYCTARWPALECPTLFLLNELYPTSCYEKAKTAGFIFCLLFTPRLHNEKPPAALCLLIDAGSLLLLHVLNWGEGAHTQTLCKSISDFKGIDNFYCFTVGWLHIY